MKILKTLSAIGILIFVIHACEHEPFPAPPPGMGNDTTDNPVDTTDPNDTITDPVDTTNQGKPCDPDTMYFERDILPILSSNCAYGGCHDAGTATEDIILDSYFNVMNSDNADVRPGDAEGSDLYEVITDNDPDKRMPPPPNQPLSADEIQKIKIWINQGAKNLSCDECETENLSFSSDIQPIFDQSCASCHSGANPPKGILLVTHSEISSAINSETVIQSMNHEPGFTKMPPSGIKLDQCKLDKIDAWVSDGMPNN